MLAVFFRSIGLHFMWFVRSLVPGQHAHAPLGWKRLVFLLIGFPLFCALQLLHWLGLLLDELLFRGYRKVQIDAPVFISGIPRSGTTFVHRTIAADTEQFTSVSTWEALLAPSITQRKIIRGCATLDRACGSPIARLVDGLAAKIVGDFNDIHEVGPSAPEEDYLWLLPAGSCFILLMAFPFSPWLKRTGLLEEMAEAERQQLIDFYLNCIKKHLYCTEGGRRFLSKNAAFASWVEPLAERLPDARFILCVREPETGLSSQLSSLKSARSLFSTDTDGTWTAATFTEIFAKNLSCLAEVTGHAQSQQMAVIDQGDLRQDPRGILEQALKRIEVSCAPRLTEVLHRIEPHAKSSHRHHSEATRSENNEIDVCLKQPYQIVLQSNLRVRPAPN